MPAHRHVHPDRAAVTEAEADAARWADDGGACFEPSPGVHAGHWLRISAALTQRLPAIAGREDVIVTCEPGTRSGAPAAFYPALAALEIDADLFAPLTPASIDPSKDGDEERYPAAWGALIHEAAHAAHSTWNTPAPLRGTAVDDAAAMLEESRAERAHLHRRPQDRRFLRACVRTLVLAEITQETPADRWQAAHAAGLILARRDAGILDDDETEPLAQMVTSILGPDLLHCLTTIWKAAHACRDDDGQGMLDHAQAWCQALGSDPARPASQPGTQGRDGRRGQLAEAIGEVLGNVEANEAAQAAAQAAMATAAIARANARAANAARNREATRIAKRVFAPGARPFTPSEAGTIRGVRSPVTGQRSPTTAEKSAAAALARALRTAAYRERIETVTTSAAPPGRLNMRGALARDAQKAAGATPTARPWSHTQRRHTPTPPLRVGIAVDVSGSMSAATVPIVSAAWILAKAAALTDPDSRAATVAYDASLTAITAPGRTPAHVTEFAASGRGHSLAEAIDALTAGLDLNRPGTGRLLVIASDGYYATSEATRAAERTNALATAGCAVLWLAFAPDPRPLPGTTLVLLNHPARAASAIAKAATAAITATHSDSF
ncbi:hypothetical protein ABIA33_007365 [Streptacidiphilus sp. MAP12-16]|uniref:hypothetical protein n=1 Tax=Streptacidiphilus sp. MAP12-16 TaxID=3156300 RepID=UPI0035189D9E